MSFCTRARVASGSVRIAACTCTTLGPFSLALARAPTHPDCCEADTPRRAHCYKRSAFKSSLYVVQDVILLGALIYGAYHIESFLGRL